MKKRKGYRAGTSSVRQDYRQGGRVKLYGGGIDFEIPIFDFPITPMPPVVIPPTTAQVEENEKEKEREENMAEQKEIAEQLAKGEGTLPTIPDAAKVDTGPEATAQSLAPSSPITTEQAVIPTTTTADTIAETAQIQAPAQLTAQQAVAAQAATPTTITGAEGQVSTEAIAAAPTVEQVAPIQAEPVEIKQGALTERVVGTLSPAAMATAAQAGGTSLSRVTRAKKQLRNSGLSEANIIELGNDPETLETKLTEFTEAERGIIAGLPEEALVSNQLDSLLTGIENGQIPTWASPAVAAVEQMLAQRGLDASTVGRDALLNTIIQSALPIAQSNAQAIQSSFSQDKNLEAQIEIKNAEFRQQTALSNADKVFNLNLAQFNADQQTALSNSKFLQTVSLTEANNKQQAAIQNAVLTSQINLAQADINQKNQIQNAQAFLQMDLSNLSNEQQSIIVQAQQQQQTLLSNQAAANAASQFNATSVNQTNQFMSSLASQVDQYNVGQQNAVSQFNAQQSNAQRALEFQIGADISKANATMVNNISQFNAQQDFERDKFNVTNAQAIEQSNLAWRRQANTINTAAQNAINQQNAQNAFQMSSQAQAFLWQELRDQANYSWQSSENDQNRKAQLYAQALANEGGSSSNWSTNLNSITTVLNTMFNKVT